MYDFAFQWCVGQLKKEVIFLCVLLFHIFKLTTNESKAKQMTNNSSLIHILLNQIDKRTTINFPRVIELCMKIQHPSSRLSSYTKMMTNHFSFCDQMSTVICFGYKLHINILVIIYWHFVFQTNPDDNRYNLI